MKKFHNTIFYISIIGGFSAIVYWIISSGKILEEGKHVVERAGGSNIFQDFLNALTQNLHLSTGILLLQVLTIIVVSRLFGLVFKKMGQPMVIGEIIAGIALGPSLLGLYLPEVSGFIFPANSLGSLQVLSQIGLILFMFIIGMELNLNVLKNKAHEAVVISHASIIIPFTLGVGFAYFIYSAFAPEGVEFASFALFLGISMSITAFPVLARIIQERGMQKSRVGAMAITCAAADDITAWCLLAAVIAIVKAGSFVSSIFTIILAVAYVALMVKVARPFLLKIGAKIEEEKKVGTYATVVFFLTLLISAYITEVIGIHALFGAFMAGTIMPINQKIRSIFIEKIEAVTLVLLLPIFFVITGLRTEIGLLDTTYLWSVTGMIILVAVVGKFGGSTFAAKYVGQSWKESLTIGALMNTRGLMELVVLNIGYDLGVLNAEIFAMMVIMALVTTFMTGPILNLINLVFKPRRSKAINNK